MRRLFVLLCLCSIVVVAAAQEPLRAMFYNVENLFDCRHDSLKNDREFLPDALRRWTPKRFHEKVNNIAKVILAASRGRVPDLIGLCEVENDYCLQTLTRYSPLREADYRYVMTDSPDRRGIDVALLYQRGSFRLLGKEDIRIPTIKKRQRPTRDILHVIGRVISGDTLDVFVCHMPSRSGGAKESESFRLHTARVLRRAADSVMVLRAHPNVLIMGDFNDYPKNKSISLVLGAEAPTDTISPRNLYNLMAGRREGTYKYRWEWGIFDQIMVSGHLLQGHAALRTSYDQAQILRFPFLLEEDNRYGGEKPFRSYYGMKYQGGFSDHLPICVDFEIGP